MIGWHSENSKHEKSGIYFYRMNDPGSLGFVVFRKDVPFKKKGWMFRFRYSKIIKKWFIRLHRYGQNSGDGADEPINPFITDGWGDTYMFINDRWIVVKREPRDGNLSIKGAWPKGSH